MLCASIYAVLRLIVGIGVIRNMTEAELHGELLRRSFRATQAATYDRLRRAAMQLRELERSEGAPAWVACSASTTARSWPLSSMPREGDYEGVDGRPSFRVARNPDPESRLPSAQSRNGRSSNRQGVIARHVVVLKTPSSFWISPTIKVLSSCML